MLHGLLKKRILKQKRGRLECLLDDQKVFLEFNLSYLPYTTDTYDGFLVWLLPLAMKEKKDIIIQGPVSFKLYHNITNYLMKIITIIHPECELINIYPESFKYEKKFDNNGIGAGLSCGVDSLCCFQDYYFNNFHKSIKITHACNFHVGGAVNLQQYNKRLNNVRKFVQKTDLKLLNVVTNFQKSNEFPYSTIHIFRNVPVVLCFQKLFKKYYYSSCDPYPDLKIFNCNESDIYIKIYDPIIIPLLSTEETEFSLHGSQYVRNDKILKISKNHLTYNHLDVCVDSHYLMENNKTW